MFNLADRDVLTWYKHRELVFDFNGYKFYKLPAIPLVLRVEGCFMRHCLATDYESYSRRMAEGEIDIYSMTLEVPVVDIEVALKRGSYCTERVESPVVTQIRGIANQMPPENKYISAIMKFLSMYGSNWKLTGHRIHNFDGRLDGDEVLERWIKLKKATKNK
jgi:hypothetical protein